MPTPSSASPRRSSCAPTAGCCWRSGPTGKPYAGYWEFPGGKLEPGETAAHALARELREELGIDVARAAPWLVQEFVYPHAHVELNFFRVFGVGGRAASGHDGQAFAWQQPGAFDVAPLLPANTRVLAALALPPVYGVTCADDLGEDAFLARAEARVRARAAARAAAREGLAASSVATRSRGSSSRSRARIGARVLLNGSVDDARRCGFAGVHWTARDARRGERAPARHARRGVVPHARRARARGRARASTSRCSGRSLPRRRIRTRMPLGWEGFAAAVAGTRVPVYAIGGLAPGDLDAAIDRGAHGVALRRGAWR